jgi:hypothetical protein
MLTRARLKRGEKKLASYNREIQTRIRKREMDSPIKLGPYKYEEDFFKAFNLMQSMVVITPRNSLGL